MNSSRYYYQRLRAGPKSGSYRIQDRVLGHHIAECTFRENAELISGALNAMIENQTARVPSPPPISKVVSNDPASNLCTADLFASDIHAFPIDGS